MSRGDENERRLYERIAGGGAEVTLRIGGGPAVQATIEDISRGGVSVAYDCAATIGTDAEITLPRGGVVKGRIARNTNGSLGFAFRQDEASLLQIDQTLTFIEQGVGQRAA